MEKRKITKKEIDEKLSMATFHMVKTCLVFDEEKDKEDGKI